MLSLRRPIFFPSVGTALPKLPLPTLQIPKLPLSRISSSSVKMAAKAVEHVVLFRVKPDAEPSKVDAMISSLNSLTTLPAVLHLTAGPISRLRSQSLDFTHLLHSRYRTKEDLAAYSAHPAHVSVVKESVLPVCDDIMAVDWEADLDGPALPPAGAAMRVTLLKLKEGLGDGEKGEVMIALGGIKGSFPEVEQISFGENFSPARAKGFTVGSVSIFPGKKEMEALDEKGETVEMHKEKVRGLLDSVVVVDYEILTPAVASL
ncbi:hypothetical protein ACLOJK_025419 [Asimina triloba]